MREEQHRRDAEAAERRDRMDEHMLQMLGDDLEKILEFKKMQLEDRKMRHREKMKRLKNETHDESDEDVDELQQEGSFRASMLNKI